MTVLKLENVCFNQEIVESNASIAIESLKRKKQIEAIVQINWNGSVDAIVELFEFIKDVNLSSFLNFLKESFNNLTNNHKIDILHAIYKKLWKDITWLFLKEIHE